MSSPNLKTYHCLCTTLLLATPHALATLPRRAPPSLDRAFILPLPPFPSTQDPSPSTPPTSNGESPETEPTPPPSLILPSFRPQRKVVVVQRADGWERRRVWRCGRCGVGVGYETEGAQGVKERVIYLLEGGLVETGEMVGGECGYGNGI